MGNVNPSDAADAVKPFLGLVDTIIKVSKAVLKAHRKSQYNKKTCGALLNRVEFAECTVKSLVRHKEDHIEDFRTQDYYLSFAKFTCVMEKIRKFVEDISQLSGFKKFTNSQSVKDMLRAILEDFDTCSSNLRLQTFTDTEKDMKILNDDLKQMKFLTKLDCETEMDVNQEYSEKFIVSLNTVEEQVKIMTSEINKKNTNLINQVNQIPFEELKNPNGTNRIERGNIIKRRYKGVDVACKKVNITADDEIQVKRFKMWTSILEKLHLCDNIIRFYGMSKADGSDYMVYGWAERRDLKEIYENEMLTLCEKSNIALGICQGLVFLNAIGIYHHDIRCENILMTSELKPKITNFAFARGMGEVIIEKNSESSLNWMAPEKMEEYRHTNLSVKYTYTTGCEIFSFGMLLWELMYERIPYRNKNIVKLISHVTSGKREELSYNSSPCGNDQNQKYVKIIRKAWEHDPSLRIELASLFDEIRELNTCNKHGEHTKDAFLT